MQEKFENLGVRIVEGFLPRNWFQFADDAAATTALESENQLLLNLFSRWCSWADMSIRSDKCHSFGLKKVKTASTQFKPKVYINNKLVKSLDAGESFLYLGQHFDYEMSEKDHKASLTTNLKEYMEKIDCLDLHPKNKILISKICSQQNQLGSYSIKNFHHMD